MLINSNIKLEIYNIIANIFVIIFSSLEFVLTTYTTFTLVGI